MNGINKEKDKCKYVENILEGCAPLQCRLLNNTPWILSDDLGFRYINHKSGICSNDVFHYCPFCGFEINQERSKNE